MAPMGPSPLIAPPWGATSYPPLCGWYVISSDSEVQVIDNSTTILDGQAPQLADK